MEAEEKPEHISQGIMVLGFFCLFFSSNIPKNLMKGNKISQAKAAVFENQIQDEILRLHGLFLENWIAKA